MFKNISLANRIVKVKLDTNFEYTKTYSKVCLVRKAQKLLGISTWKAIRLVEEIFPEIQAYNSMPVTKTLLQKISYWYHKKLFEKSLG